ncbi:MAG TPA: PQQ-dependent dehydrogenase, methanol/ethanol family [Vicinamibacterales bacterium]|nr:PQQ-dependent dehydrogenase, methanol/ethanol family [Vicinamibacterales bacterium]
MARPRRLVACCTVALIGLLSLRLQGQVTSQRLTSANSEPQNWLTYSGNYSSHRFSLLDQITPANVKNLELQWVYQAPVAGNWQTTPIVVDGMMYITQRPNDIIALDAVTGRLFWIYRYTPNPDRIVCCGANNRGIAILGDTLFMGTLDANLIAVDAKSGRQIWKTEVASTTAGYSITHAPLIVKDKVIVGVGGGEYGIRGFVAAYNVNTGKEAWRFYTIPGPGEKGHETWEACPPKSDGFCDPDAWKHGGGSIWMTGSYDPKLNLTYWGVGNVGPDYAGAQRPGDNLYTDSVVALDVDTGALRWHYQFTPHDVYDYDSVQVPVLVDNWGRTGIDALVWANRNGNYYALDRATGKFLLGRPFVKVNWMSDFDERGRPNQTPQPPGQPTYPGNQGGTNWYSPSFSPRTNLFYVSAWEDYASIYGPSPVEYRQGTNFTGGGPRPFGPVPGAPSFQRAPINTWTESAGHGAVLALDVATGDQKWKFAMTDVTDSGILTTASNLLFAGGREGYFQALDARTGALLWKTNLGGAINSGPMTYRVGNKQYVATVSGLSLFVFALKE